MIEAERQLGLRHRDELLFLIAPARRLFARAEAEQESLIGQRNRRAPVEAERAEIRNRSDAACGHLACHAAFARQLDELRVTAREIGERRLVGVADDRNHDPFARFDRDADIDRLANESRVRQSTARRRAGCLRERQSERAQCIQRRARFWIAALAVAAAQDRGNGESHRGERTRPTAPHRIGDAGADRARLFRRLPFDSCRGKFPDLDRHAARRFRCLRCQRDQPASVAARPCAHARAAKDNLRLSRSPAPASRRPDRLEMRAGGDRRAAHPIHRSWKCEPLPFCVWPP